MRKIAIMASYPARRDHIAEAANSIASQVEELNLVLNEWSGPPPNGLPDNVNIIFPDRDLKDTGKFVACHRPDDFVLLCDDDILYPTDYAEVMMRRHAELANGRGIVCVHGVTYADFFDGDPSARLVHVFNLALPKARFVNQAGTGTVGCRGWQMPTLTFMAGSERFVDLRFAVHCKRNDMPILCVDRTANWLVDKEAGNALFATFTSRWPVSVVREAQEVAGFRFLPVGLGYLD